MSNRDFAKLFRGGEGVGKIVGLFESLVSEAKDADAGLVVDEKPACAHF
jgi:hypothetical protein